MEFEWSQPDSGNYGAGGEGFPIGDSRTTTQILERNPAEHDFECTYFRQPTTRTPSKLIKKGDGLFPITIAYALSSELSDGYTDSDSESDNTSNVERWLESLPANDAWSSAPNYAALDGSEGLEGADEIQENVKRIPQDYLTNSTNKTPESVEDFGETVTEDNSAKRTSGKRDEISVITEWLDGQKLRKKMKRTLRNRQKTEPFMSLERETRVAMDDDDKLLARKSDVQETDVSHDETTTWSKNDTLETTGIRTTSDKRSVEENGYDKTMREMVNRLLIASTNREETLEENKSDENSKLQPQATKKAKLSSKINGNRIKIKEVAAKSAIKTRKQIPKRRRRISSDENRRLKPAEGKIPLDSGIKSFSENVNSGKKISQCRTVRFADELTPSEAWKKTAMLKAARNKQILQTVEKIVGNIKSEDFNIFAKTCETQKASLKFTRETENGNTVKSAEGWDFQMMQRNRKRPINSIDDKKIVKNQKPMFVNPFVENCLDKAMEHALNKYKNPRNTWEDFVSKKIRGNISSAVVYEPPAKKSKPKSCDSKLENMPCQDFSLLNTWQSVHNYFLLHSSCK